MYCVCILKLNFAGGTMKNKISLYIISVVCTLAVGGLSALLTAGNMELYQDIVRPPLAPPAFLFPIVWTILYTVMGIGAAAEIFPLGSEARQPYTQAMLPSLRAIP